MGTHSSQYRIVSFCLLLAVILSSCSLPMTPQFPAAIASRQQEVSSAQAQRVQTTGYQSSVSSATTETVSTTSGLEHEYATPRVIRITSVARAPGSDVTVKVVESTPTSPVPTAISRSTEIGLAGAEPLIFTSIGIDQKCGHGDVVALDGHTLRASPHIPVDDSNYLGLLPEGTRVDLIDCRLWVDENDHSWIAVRTGDGKLGWVLIQPDKFYITLYPIPADPPRALTGLPTGASVAYVPSSSCQPEPASNEALATSIGIDFIPVVGDLKGLGEAATGCDMITGENLGNWRWLGLLGIIGLGEIALLRHGDEAADAARFASNLEGSLRYSDEIAVLGRNADTAADLARGASRLDSAAGAAADTGRVADSGVALSDEMAQALARFEQPCSFSADTLVTTASGPVPIKAVSAGDLVLSYDEADGVAEYHVVTATHVHLDSNVVAVSVGSDILRTTSEHPFYVDGEWLPAGQLQIGDTVLSADGQSNEVTGVEPDQCSQLMYNLTVAETHTFFVGSDESLVHNACSRVLRTRLSFPEPADWQGGKIEWEAHHVIPGQFENEDIVQMAKRGGWDIDGASNGIALPSSDEQAEELCRLDSRLCLPIHRGPHDQYSDIVGEELRILQEKATAENWSERRVAQELDKVAERLRTHIRQFAHGEHLK